MYQYYEHILKRLGSLVEKILINDTLSSHADAAFVKLLSNAKFKQVTIGGGLTSELQPNVNAETLRMIHVINLDFTMLRLAFLFDAHTLRFRKHVRRNSLM